MKQYRTNVMICAGTGCVAAGSLKIKAKIEEELAKQNLSEEIGIVLTGCNGFCAKGPIVSVFPEGIFYQLLKEEDIPHLVEEHFLKGRPVSHLMYQPEGKRPIPLLSEIPF
ncbi:MAG: (2Fe-2S) ferredoxin domain-containing protein, partial [bacterium]